MRRAAIALAVALITISCEERLEAPQAAREAPAPAPTDVEVAPPLPGSTDACALALAERTPAEVRQTLEDLSYDTAFRDACIAARAEAGHSLALCAELGVTALRDRCRERVAIATGDPTGCPAARSRDGHDPLCLALASRDPRLCVAAGTVERAVCEAVLVDGDAHACARLPVELRAACTSRITRLAALASFEVERAEALETSASLTIGDAEPLELAIAARGARIAYAGCEPTLELGEERATGLHRPESTWRLRVPAAGAAPYESTIGVLGASIEVETHELRSASVANGRVSIAALDRTLGGRVEGSFAGQLANGTTPVSVSGAFVTFVRDIEERPEECPSP